MLEGPGCPCTQSLDINIIQQAIMKAFVTGRIDYKNKDILKFPSERAAGILGSGLVFYMTKNVLAIEEV